MTAPNKVVHSPMPAPTKTAKPSNKPSPEEIEAKRQARATKKQAEQQRIDEISTKLREAALGNTPDDGGEFLSRNPVTGDRLYLPRHWQPLPNRSDLPISGRPLRLLSWNMLAQGLVRRSLFPGSDALRMGDREAGLEAELVGHRFDLGCFQEVDRIDIHGATLAKSGYSYLYEKGYSAKKHGLMIAWRTHPRKLPGDNTNDAVGPVFEPKPVAQKLIYLDSVDVARYLPMDGGRTTPAARRACSRITRNVALLVAVPFRRPHGRTGGVIAATTHTFWHPMHGYERARQVGIILRELDAFRQSNPAFKDWPIVFGGDFNDQPDSMAYSLLTGAPPTPAGIEEVRNSTVVHQSIDQLAEREKNAPSQETGEQEEQDEEEEEEEGEETEEQGEQGEGESDDRLLKHCRYALPVDGLLSLDELNELFNISGTSGRAQSTYGTYNRDTNNMFGTPGPRKERWNDESWTPDTPNPHEGPCKEPMFTLFSPLFSLTLDYLMLFPTSESDATTPAYPTVSALLPTHPKEVLQVGLPRKGVCCSDHIPIGAEILID